MRHQHIAAAPLAPFGHDALRASSHTCPMCERRRRRCDVSATLLQHRAPLYSLLKKYGSLRHTLCLQHPTTSFHKPTLEMACKAGRSTGRRQRRCVCPSPRGDDIGYSAVGDGSRHANRRRHRPEYLVFAACSLCSTTLPHSRASCVGACVLLSR